MPDSRRAYLDYNATAPLRPEARAAMVAVLDARGNASSVHAEGRAARARIETARGEVARLVGADARTVTFTAGGTEANNTVLTPDWSFNGKPVRFDTLIVSAVEHVSVIAGGRFAPEAVRTIPVDGNGVVDLAALERMLAGVASEGKRALVSVMLANNETGVIQPVAEVARIGHAASALVHTDAIQAAGRMPIAVTALGVDVLTLSAHKIGGPQGAGAIVRASEAWTFMPLARGGGQEKRLRAGTENVAAIAGFGAAAKAAAGDLSLTKGALYGTWRDRLAEIVIAGASKIGKSATIFAMNAPRLPQTLCFAVPELSAETALIALDLAGVAVSSGSACSSGKVAQSHVLAAMGVPPALAKCAIRISLGWASTEADLDLFATAWRHVLEQVASGATKAA
jgi:cysteine desulfurase